MSKNSKQPLYHFLIAGKVIFVTEEGNPGTQELNCVITSPTNTFPSKLIGKAQQTLQYRFAKQIGEEVKVNFLDVFIQSVSPLGRMTEDVFNEIEDAPKPKPEAPATTADILSSNKGE